MVKKDNKTITEEENLIELLNSIENERIIDDLSVKELIYKENKDFDEFDQLIDDEDNYLDLFSKLKQLSKSDFIKDQKIKTDENKNNIHNLMHSYKSLTEDNKLSLELPYNIERADIKIDGNPKHIDFNDSLIEGNNKIINKTLELKKSNQNNKISNQNSEQKELNINEEIIEEIIQTVNRNPRITLWSIKSASVLRYLRKTKPEFSISKEASTIIDEAIKEKYPEIWKLFEDIE